MAIVPQAEKTKPRAPVKEAMARTKPPSIKAAMAIIQNKQVIEQRCELTPELVAIIVEKVRAQIPDRGNFTIKDVHAHYLSAKVKFNKTQAPVIISSDAKRYYYDAGSDTVYIDENDYE